MKTHIIRQTHEQTDIIFSAYLDSEISELIKAGNLPVKKEYLTEPPAEPGGGLKGGRIIVIIETVTQFELNQVNR